MYVDLGQNTIVRCSPTWEGLHGAGTATIPASMWASHVTSLAHAFSLGITVKSSASAVPLAPTGIPAAAVRLVSARLPNVPAIWPYGSVILTYVTSVEQVRPRAGGRGLGEQWRRRMFWYPEIQVITKIVLHGMSLYLQSVLFC